MISMLVGPSCPSQALVKKKHMGRSRGFRGAEAGRLLREPWRLGTSALSDALNPGGGGRRLIAGSAAQQRSEFGRSEIPLAGCYVPRKPRKPI